ncbi:MAG: membrane-bound lytic murein transglycosylase MltF [Gammaproteobacteria bacterium]|nr:membrane-bound lytic murein transglycosylase MltF [Gammaproteobacteria bacterium]MCP5136307.1 membrane-bound lytic murein transglycosylase MltF [Gammaproteobacteria bacterium]
MFNSESRLHRQQPWVYFVLGFGVLLLLASWINRDRRVEGVDVDSIRRGGELVILTRNAPTTYYEDRDEQTVGFEHDLASAFAKRLGVTPRFLVLDTLEELFAALTAGRGHLIAAGITRTDSRERVYGFGSGYQNVQQQLVCNRNAPIPAKPADLLSRKLIVIAGSSYLDSLNRLREQLPALTWTVSSDHDTEQLLEAVANGAQDCTVADSNIVAINRRYYPELAVAFPMGEQETLGWVTVPEARGLIKEIDRFIESAETGGTIAALYERYYGHIEIFDYQDLSVFRQRIGERLPEYRELFEAAGKKHHLPWTLLAAQAYQESHWDPRAKSPTGVRGIMMLTQPTADAMGVEDRLDPNQSIFGGAKYLERLRNRLSKEMTDPDETLWQALAAYNVGMAHLRDARILAKRHKRRPNRWHDLKEILPLLEQRPFFKTLKHGYARGQEPVRYVQRVREYEQVLKSTLR